MIYGFRREPIYLLLRTFYLEVSMRKFVDMTGLKIGRLTVIERVKGGTVNCTLWKCKCECGNETIVRSTQEFKRN